MSKQQGFDPMSLVKSRAQLSSTPQPKAALPQATSAPQSSGGFDPMSLVRGGNEIIPTQAPAPSIVTPKKKEEEDTGWFGGMFSSDSDSEKSKPQPAEKPMSMAFLDAMSYGTGKKISPKTLAEKASQGEYVISEEEKAKRKELDDYYKSEAFLPSAINPFAHDVWGLNSLPKFLASGVFRAGQAMDGVALFMAKATEDVKALGMQTGMAALTGSLKPFELDTHEKVKDAQQSLAGGDRVQFLGELANSLGDTAGVLSRSAKKDMGWSDDDMNKGVSDFVMEGSIGKAIGAAYAGVLENVPQMALLAASGGTAAGVFAGSTAMGLGAAITDEYKQDSDITYADSGIALAKGLVEGVTETIFRTDIEAARSLGKSVFNLHPSEALDSVKRLIKEEGADAAKAAIVRDAKTVMKKMLGGAFEEGSEEILATLGEFAIDTTRSGKWNQIDYERLTKNVVDSFVIGAASGGLMSGGAAIASYKPLTQEQQNKVDKYMEVANNEELPQEVRDIAQKKADDIVKYNADKYFKEYTQIANLPLQDRVAAIKISNEIKALEDSKKEVKDVDTVAEIDKAIEAKSQEVQDIIQNHTLNLADELISSPNTFDGNVAFSTESNLTVSPERGYVFLFDSKDQMPERLRGVAPINESEVEGREKKVYRVSYTGQDLIDAGLATKAEEVTPEQVSQVTAEVESTANAVQEILDKAPDTLPTVSTQFQEQEGKTVAQQISEAYHEAKKSDTNPELVSEVETAIANSLTTPTMASQPVVTRKPKRKAKNPETLKGMKPTEGVEITPNIENDFTGVLGKMGRGTKRVLQNYVKALRSVNPEAKMFYYENAAAMEKGLRNSGFSPAQAKQRASNAGGLFTTVKNGNVVIHVNRNADLITSGENKGMQSNVIAAHEVVHAVLLEVARTNPSEFITMKDSLLKMLARDEAANAEIMAFVERYSSKTEEVKAEEFLAQLGALITRQHAELKRSTLENIKTGIREFLQKIASKFRSKTLMDLVDSTVFAENAKAEETARFLEGLGRSLREGTDIDMKYIKNLTKGSREYQQGLRQSVIESVEPLPAGMDINTMMDNNMSVDPETIKESALEEGNWIDNPENKKKITKYMSTIKGMTEDDIWLAKAIAYNENKGIKLYTFKDKESVLAALELQMADLYTKVDEEISGQYQFAKDGILWETGGYLFTGWKPEYIDSRIILFTNDYNADQLLRWNTIKSDPNYHRQEVGVIREIQKKALLANISEFNGHSEFDSAFSYMLINSMIYNKYSVAENQETGESEVKVFKYKQNQLATTDASYATLQYEVAKALYDSENSKESAGDIGIAYQKAYMSMSKLNVVNSKFSKYIDKKSSTGEGYWLKFPKGGDPIVSYDLFEIAKTSHKYPAKWCTGASDSTATMHSKGGDFYIFVDNKTGDARIAVRYTGNKINEVRGLGEGQAVLPEDSELIKEIADTFKDGKSYDSYSKTLKDTQTILKNFLTKEELGYFILHSIDDSSVFGKDRYNDFTSYIANNFSVDDIARIILEEDRSYNEQDYLLQNIQAGIKYRLNDILEEMGESPYAIVKNFYPSTSDIYLAKEIKHVLGTLYVGDDREYDFENLVSAGNIEIGGLQTSVIANKLKNVNYIEVSDGSFASESLQYVNGDITLSGSNPSINVPNLKSINGRLLATVWGDDVNNFDSLESCNILLLKPIGGEEVNINFPKLNEARRIQIRNEELPTNIILDLPSIDNDIPELYMSGYSGANATVNINENNDSLKIKEILVDGGQNTLTVNATRINANELNIIGESGLVLNSKDGVTIAVLELNGGVEINNVSGVDDFVTDISVANLTGDSILNIVGDQTILLETARLQSTSKILGNISSITSLELQGNANTEISANTIKRVKVGRNARLNLRDNNSIDKLELLDGSFTFLDSKKIGSISGFYSSLLGKNLESVDDLMFNLENGNNIFLPNLKKVNNMLVLTGKIKKNDVDLSVLESVNSVSIDEGNFELMSLQNAESVILQSGKLEAGQLKSASKVLLGDGSDLYAPQLKIGYELQSLYGEFDSKESNNRVFDENGGQEFEREPSDVKESVFGDIGQPSRQELEKREKKSAGEYVREIYKDLFERNENARKAFAESDMTFSLYSMYLKAGASPFAMYKFADYYDKIFGGLNKLPRIPQTTVQQTPIVVGDNVVTDFEQPNLVAQTAKKHIDSVNFLNRVIAVDENFDNQGKKRPAHPPIPQDNAPSIPTNKESAEAELEKYKEAWGEEYYNAIQERSKLYFEAFSEILKYRYENGLISKEDYELYKDYSYSPRVFLDHFLDVNGISPNTFMKRGVALSGEQIKRIDKGDTGFMMMDSERLLKTALIATEIRVATNRALKFIYEEGVTRMNNLVKDANYESYKKDGQIKLNPDGTPKVKDATSGFVNKTYRDNNGKAYTFQMRSDIAKEFDDVDVTEAKSVIKTILKYASGSPILQKMAVSLQPFFALVNPIIDLSTQVMFSNTYKGAGRGLIAQSFAATKTFVGLTREMMAMNANEKFRSRQEAMSRNTELRDLINEYGQAGGFMTTQTEASAGTWKLAKALGYLGNVTEVTAKVSAYKFIKESMLADYAANNIDEVTGEPKEPSEEDMRKIRLAAAYHARNTLDYNRGGKVAKSMSQYTAFLNVNLQVKKIGVKYMITNKADFARKMADGIFVTAAITLANLLVGADDYEKDKGIKKHKVDKTVILFPFTYRDMGIDIDGRPYLALPTPTIAKTFFNVGQVMAEEMYYKAVGKENPNKGSAVYRLIDDNLKMLSRDLIGMWLPPTLKGWLSYTTNYDFWTQDLLTKETAIVGSSQGANNKDILGAVKWMSQSIDKLTSKDGLGFGGGYFSPSPEKLQKAIEMTTTSPAYNPVSNLAYWMIDNMFNVGYKELAGKEFDPRMQSKFVKENPADAIANTMGKGFGRLVKSTDPSKYNEPDYSANSDIREEVKLVDARISTKRNEIYNDLRNMYKESKDNKGSEEALARKYTSYRAKFTDPRESEYALNIGQFFLDKNNVSLPSNANKYYDITNVGEDPKAKAFAIWRHFGDIRGNQIILHDLKSLKVPASVIHEYNGILIQKKIIEAGDGGRPIYEEWYKSMLNSNTKPSEAKTSGVQTSGVNPPLSAISSSQNKVSPLLVASTINASVKTAETVAGVFNSIGSKLNDIEKTVAGKIELIGKTIESNEKFQDAKAVVKNPDLILAAIQRQFDKGDESGVVPKKIVVPKQVTPQFSLTGGKPIVASDTTNLGNLRNSNSEYLATSSITDLNKVNVGERNRGDYKEGQSNLIASFLQPFTQPKDLSNDKMYVGVKNGKLVTGNGDKVKDAQSVTQTPFAQVVEISDELIKNQSYLFPKLKTLKAGQEEKLNISATASGKGNANNRFAGGATIIETPDGSQKYLVRGSLDQVKSAFNDLKKNTNSPYLNMYILDNGSYSTGLFTKDGKSSTEELKSYESKNVSGSHGIYLK